MTREEFEFLQQYENNLTTAYKSDYSRNINRNALERMVDIYKRVSKNNGYTINYCCAGCQLQLLKKLAKYYFDKKEKLNKKSPKDLN